MLIKKMRPPQKQKNKPGLEFKMKPKPIAEKTPELKLKFQDKVVVITGGDSGIGRAVALAFAKEGAKIAIIYLNEHRDAKETEKLIENEYGVECLLVPCDIKEEKNCQKAIREIFKSFKKIDVLINNAAEQHPQENIKSITAHQLEKTFKTNVFAMFYLIKAALPFLKKGSSIVNTSSVTAYRGSPALLDYSATKGAIISFTRSLAKNLVEKGIRVNAVAPGPIWTPLIPSTFTKNKVKSFGTDTPMKRAGEPAEVAPAFVFLASEEASYITGQVIHPNGGEIVNG